MMKSCAQGSGASLFQINRSAPTLERDRQRSRPKGWTALTCMDSVCQDEKANAKTGHDTEILGG
jgi:hypothetical protein